MSETISGGRFERYDSNDGWKPVPPCEAFEYTQARLFPVRQGYNNPDAVGRIVWEEAGFRRQRDASRIRALCARGAAGHEGSWITLYPKRKPGVYVDVSQKGKEMVLGFAVKVGEHKIKRFAMPSRSATTGQAELEAILLAKRLFPGMAVYSDHEKAAVEGGASYVPRAGNTYAHAAAKFGTNWMNKKQIKGLPHPDVLFNLLRKAS